MTLPLPKQKQCSRCQKLLDIDNFYTRKDRQSGHTSACKQCLVLEMTNKNLQLKIETFNHYGGCQCQCCGESTIEFLSIDHIMNDGAIERKKLFGVKHRVAGGAIFYRWLKLHNFPNINRYQVLCANCQQGKRLNHGICPHKENQ